MELDLRGVAIWENPPFLKINDDFLQQACHTPDLKRMHRFIPETCSPRTIAVPFQKPRMLHHFCRDTKA
jgi:hypothetical protein